MIDNDTSLLFATRNPHKTVEFESLLGDFINPLWNVFDIASWDEPVPEVLENQETFEGNAIKKALEVSHVTGSVTLADDSGLEVDALGGRPGIHSARYAGIEAIDSRNNQKLVSELKGVPGSERGARYVCVIALAIPRNKVGRTLLSRTGIPYEEVGQAAPSEEGKMVAVDGRIVIWFRGEVEGRIVDDARGSHGFGYDPHFYVPEFDRTMAEIPLEQKNTISHRARALRKMAEFFSGTP